MSKEKIYTITITQEELNRMEDTPIYPKSMADIKQEGLENSLVFKNKNQKIALSSTFSKSREDDGSPQLRRPEKQFGINF